MRSSFVYILPQALVSVFALNGFASDKSFSDESIDFFEKKIRPLLASNCYNCHSANTNSQGGLRLDDRNGQLVGGGSGPALVPGDVAASLLIKVVEHADGVASMPPKKKLTDEEIADLKKWVADGAAWPQPVAPTNIHHYDADYESLRANHWAWQPIREPQVPAPLDSSWPVDDIDRFIQHGIEQHGLVRAQQASKEVLIRRVTYDLTGLPPTPEEIDAFIADSREDAIEKVVDRLLASHAFAEKWGRHWLDVARYGESTGSSRNLPLPHAWRYRDYVINSFASDKPFQQFILEQIAGDLLLSESDEKKEEQTIGTGFLAIGVKDVNQRYKVRFVMDNVDEQIDAVSRSFLGVTASCARCHNHKFDPIPTTDYYALAGIFTSTDLCAGLRNKMGGGGLAYYDTEMLITLGKVPDPTGERDALIAAAKQKFQEAQKEFQSLRNDPAGDEKLPDGRPRRQAARQAMNKAQEELVALSDPAKVSKVILGVRDGKVIGDTEVRYRGEAEQLGPKVPRGFLSLAQFENQPSVNPNQSGRLELAQWIASNDNPLTSRVVVNRIWKHLFGRGIVSTVDNFGVNGDRPTHPELLDHLALRFQANQWSVKRLIRQIVLSKTYQLSANAESESFSIDPTNQWVWRHTSRRLDAEEIRDTTLAVSGALQPTPPEASAAKDLKVIELPNNGPVARKLREAAKQATYRSVYLPLVRGITPNSLEVFDFAEQGTVTGARNTTTVPPQSLYLLNDAFVRRNALAFAEKLLKENTANDSERIQIAYRTILGRNANQVEIDRSLNYIADIQGISEVILELEKKANDGPSPQSVAVVAGNAANSPSNSDDAKPVPGGEANQVTSVTTPAAPTITNPDSRDKPIGNAPGTAVPGFELQFAIRWNFGRLNGDADARSASQNIANESPTTRKAESVEKPANAIASDKPIASTNNPPKPAPPIDPDQLVEVEPPLQEEKVQAGTAREAAWASFVQALLGSAEFRYVQ